MFGDSLSFAPALRVIARVKLRLLGIRSTKARNTANIAMGSLQHGLRIGLKEPHGNTNVVIRHMVISSSVLSGKFDNNFAK